MRIAAGRWAILVAACSLVTCGPGPDDSDPIFIPSVGNVEPPPLLPAPLQLAPPDGSVFENVPRTIVFEWQPVAEASTYTIEIDCYHCCGLNQWCTDVGQEPQTARNLTSATYTLTQWVGAQPGRWRVYAVDAGGRDGFISGWWTFTYTR